MSYMNDDFPGKRIMCHLNNDVWLEFCAATVGKYTFDHHDGHYILSHFKGTDAPSFTLATFIYAAEWAFLKILVMSFRG